MKNYKINFTTFLLFLFLNTSLTFTQDFNSIDAVSSASQKLQILGGKAYSDRAEITWKDGYTNGEEHTLKWGKTTSFGNNMNLKPFTKNQNVTTIIQNLEAGTLYHGQFYRTYEGTIKKTNFQFQTTDGTANIDKNINLAHRQNSLTKIKSINIIENSIYVSYQISTIGKYSITVYSINGKMITKFFNEHRNTGQHSDLVNINAKTLSNGIYLITLKNSSGNYAKIFNLSK